MKFSNIIKKWISYLSIITLFSLQIAPLQAAMVSSETLIEQAHQELTVKNITTLLDHDEVQSQLVAMGVDPVAAKIRVNQMNAAELAELNQRLDELPAGSGALGVVLAIFILFVITDMLGATDIFPFVKNINK